jgi:hypothetical protein
MTKEDKTDVFKAELEKFTPHRIRIADNVVAQSRLLETLAATFGELGKSDIAKQSDRIGQVRATVTQRLMLAYKSYDDVKTNLK